MTPLTVTGYGIDATFDGETLRAHPHTRTARAALAGLMTEEQLADPDAKHRVDEHLADLVLPVSEIAGVEWKDASMLTNGRMTIHTTAGRAHALYFRRKQAKEMAALRDALGG